MRFEPIACRARRQLLCTFRQQLVQSLRVLFVENKQSIRARALSLDSALLQSLHSISKNNNARLGRDDNKACLQRPFSLYHGYQHSFERRGEARRTHPRARHSSLHTFIVYERRNKQKPIHSHFLSFVLACFSFLPAVPSDRILESAACDFSAFLFLALSLPLSS